MPGSTLVLHRGGKAATREEVAAVAAPPATDTWHPVSHISVLARVEELIDTAGYSIARQQLALARDGARFFAVMDLEARVAEGVGLALGLRNSIDRSFPYGLAGGTRCFTCDNLALTGDWGELTIRRKHTRFGARRFAEALAAGIGRLGQYRELEGRRIEVMRSTAVTDTEAYALFMRAFEQGLLGHRVLRECLGHWKGAGYDWGPPTRWRLYNAMTAPLQSRATSNPQAFAYQTMRLMGLVGPESVQDESPPDASSCESPPDDGPTRG